MRVSVCVSPPQGADRVVPLVPGGSARAVEGPADACEFAWRAGALRAVGGTWPQAAALRRGVAAVLGQDVLDRLSGVLTGEDLSVLLGGEQRCDLADWRAHTVLSEGLSAADAEVRAFWAAMERELTEQERCDVLAFATGLPFPPAGGFKNLAGYLGDPMLFKLMRLPEAPGAAGATLPMAAACFNTLKCVLLVLFSYALLRGAFGFVTEPVLLCIPTPRVSRVCPRIIAPQ